MKSVVCIINNQLDLYLKPVILVFYFKVINIFFLGRLFRRSKFGLMFIVDVNDVFFFWFEAKLVRTSSEANQTITIYYAFRLPMKKELR